MEENWFQQFMPQHSNFDWPQFWNAYASPQDYSPLFYTLHPDFEPFQAWSRQMISTLYQNWYNSESQKMARMKEAGINPYLAAQGIAGSGGSSGSVASAPPQGNAAASMEALANGPLAVADVVSKGVASYDTLKTLSHRLPNLDANTRKALTDAGFTEAETDGILIDNMYKQENWLADLNIKRQQFSNMQRDYELIKSQRDFIQKQLDWYDAKMITDISLEEMQTLQMEKQKMFIESQTTMQNLENQWTEKYWSKMSDPVNVALKNLFIRSLDTDNPLQMFEKGYQELMSYYTNKAEIDAESVAAATWMQRPSNPWEYGAFMANFALNVTQHAIDGSLIPKSLRTKLKNANVDDDEDFEDAYNEVKSQLHSEYRNARKIYREYKNTAVADSYKAQLKQNMITARATYENFSREEFKKTLTSCRW